MTVTLASRIDLELSRTVWTRPKIKLLSMTRSSIPGAISFGVDRVKLLDTIRYPTMALRWVLWNITKTRANDHILPCIEEWAWSRGQTGGEPRTHPGRSLDVPAPHLGQTLAELASHLLQLTRRYTLTLTIIDKTMTSHNNLKDHLPEFCHLLQLIQILIHWFLCALWFIYFLNQPDPQRNALNITTRKAPLSWLIQTELMWQRDRTGTRMGQGWIFGSHQVFPGFMSLFLDIY